MRPLVLTDSRGLFNEEAVDATRGRRSKDEGVNPFRGQGHIAAQRLHTPLGQDLGGRIAGTSPGKDVIHAGQVQDLGEAPRKSPGNAGGPENVIHASNP